MRTNGDQRTSTSIPPTLSDARRFLALLRVLAAFHPAARASFAALVVVPC